MTHGRVHIVLCTCNKCSLYNIRTFWDTTILYLDSDTDHARVQPEFLPDMDVLRWDSISPFYCQYMCFYLWPQFGFMNIPYWLHVCEKGSKYTERKSRIPPTVLYKITTDRFLSEPWSQYTQSPRLSIQSAELDPPIPHPPESVAPPLWIQGGVTLACGGGGGVPIPTMGQTLWYSRCTLISLRLWAFLACFIPVVSPFGDANNKCQ